MASPEKFLIIGGQGSTGSWIAKVLLDEGLDFLLFDRRPDNSSLLQVIDPEDLSAIRRLFGDPGDPAALARVIQDHRITRLIHLEGAGGSAGRSGGVREEKARVAGLSSSFEAVRASRGDVAMTVYASEASGAREEDARKRFLDHRIPSIGLRGVEVYGVGRQAGPAESLTRAIKAAVLDRRFAIPFAGSVDLAYVEDVARTFIAAAISGAPSALVGKPRTEDISVEGFIQKLAEAVPGSAGRITSLGEQMPAEILIDESRLDELPGAECVRSTPLEDGIRRTVEIFRRLVDGGRLRDEA